MDALKQRLTQRRSLLLAALSSLALALFLLLYALTPQTSAAHPAKPGDNVTLTFTVTVQAGTRPGDALFWFCADAKADGSGCDEMNAQPDGSYTYQLATTTGTTYQDITIEWSHGRLPSSSGPIPVPPAHIACDYRSFNVTASNPRSFTCNADFTPSTLTPIPTVTPTASATASATPTPTGSDTSTLVTGLQIVTGVGLVLFFLLLAILIWQRVSARRRSSVK